MPYPQPNVQVEVRSDGALSLPAAAGDEGMAGEVEEGVAAGNSSVSGRRRKAAEPLVDGDLVTIYSAAVKRQVRSVLLLWLVCLFPSRAAVQFHLQWGKPDGALNSMA